MLIYHCVTSIIIMSSVLFHLTSTAPPPPPAFSEAKTHPETQDKSVYHEISDKSDYQDTAEVFDETSDKSFGKSSESQNDQQKVVPKMIIPAPKATAGLPPRSPPKKARQLVPPPRYGEEQVKQIEQQFQEQRAKGLPRTYSAQKRGKYLIQERMELPEGHDRRLDEVMSKAPVDELSLRRLLNLKSDKHTQELNHMEQKFSNLARQSAEHIQHTSDYAQAVDGKVDTLHEEVVRARDLAQDSVQAIGALKQDMEQYKTGVEQRVLQKQVALNQGQATDLKRVEATLKNNIERVNLLQNDQAQLGLSIVGHIEADKTLHQNIGEELTMHKNRLAKDQHSLLKTKIRTNHLHNTLKDQGQAIDHIYEHLADVRSDIHSLYDASAGQNEALALIAQREQAMMRELVASQKTAGKMVLESNRELLQGLAQVAQLLTDKVQAALQHVNQQISNIEVVQVTEVNSPFNESLTRATPSVNGPKLQLGEAPKLADKAFHAMFLKKSDPRRQMVEPKKKVEQFGKFQLGVNEKDIFESPNRNAPGTTEDGTIREL